MVQRKLIILAIGIVAIIGVVAGAFFLQPQKQPGDNIAPENKSAGSQENLENFLKQSAREMVDPLEENTKIAEEQLKQSGQFLISQGQDDYLQKGETVDCYENYYRTLVKSEGVAKALDDLKARYLKSLFVQAQCHPLTHIIGQTATATYPTAALAYQHGDSFCWSGYYHGVLEGIAGKLGKEKLVASLNDICVGIEGQTDYSFDYYNCVHGLGHGLMAMTQDELFESLSLCDNLNGVWEKQSCYGGVFMENVIVDNRNHFTEYLKPEDPLYPCTAVGDSYKQSCFLMQTSYMLKVTNGNFVKVFELCSSVDENYRPTCYQSLGRDASGRSKSDVTRTHDTCILGTNYEQQANCIIGAVKDFISYYHSNAEAQQLCDSFEEKLQAVCNTAREGYYQF